jgi:hypothetical protein
MRLFIPIFLFFFFLFSIANNDTLRITRVEELSAQYHFDVVGWEIKNLPSKWFRKINARIFPFRSKNDTSIKTVFEYFRLTGEAQYTQWLVNQEASKGNPETERFESELNKIKSQQNLLRPGVEDFLEKELSNTLYRERIPTKIGRVVFPPVALVLVNPPKMLSISPRDRIFLAETILLTPNMSVQEKERLEKHILQKENKSALVAGIGGLSTYPSFITPTGLRTTLNIAAHEWLHHYLTFQPLGRNIHKDANMRTLNETTSNIFGDELGDLIYTQLTAKNVPNGVASNQESCEEPEFCFNKEMHKTRLHVDELLDKGMILEAEKYMEEQRQIFVKNGYNIRKLNQAYFARNAPYADNPASTSPIFDQLVQLRHESSSLAQFIHTVSGISDYDSFNVLIDNLKLVRKAANKP